MTSYDHRLDEIERRLGGTCGREAVPGCAKCFLAMLAELRAGRLTKPIPPDWNPCDGNPSTFEELLLEAEERRRNANEAAIASNPPGN